MDRRGDHTGEAFDDMPIGAPQANTGKPTWFTGISVLKVEDGVVTESSASMTASPSWSSWR